MLTMPSALRMEPALGGRPGGAMNTMPVDLSLIASWHDADDQATLFQLSGGTTPVTADTNPVGYWGDKSGNARHVIQATAGSRPQYRTNVQNGRPALRFDGVDDFLGLATAFNQQSWYAVAKYSAATFTSYGGLIGDPTAGSLVLIGENGLTRWFTIDGAFANSTYTKDGVTVSLGVDFPAPMNAFANMALRQEAVRNQGLQIGRDRNLARYWNGDICEVVVAKAALSAPNDTALRAYLKAKWGTP